MAAMRLKGPIECRRTAAAGITLIGQTERGERAYVTLDARAPADLPPHLDEGIVELLPGGPCRVSCPGREWRVEGKRRFVHRDVSAAFYAVLPPRPVRLTKRLLFRLMLTAASSRAGRWWLAR